MFSTEINYYKLLDMSSIDFYPILDENVNIYINYAIERGNNLENIGKNTLRNRCGCQNGSALPGQRMCIPDQFVR